MLRNNVTQREDYKDNQSTIKTKHTENAQFYQLLNTTRKKIANDHPPIPTKKVSMGRSTSVNTTQELDSQKISASNNHNDLYSNPPDMAYNTSSKDFKTFKMPIGKNIQNKLQLFESMKQKNESVVTKQENIQPQTAKLNCTASETHQSKLNADVMQELHNIRCQKSYTPLPQMPKLLDINELNVEKSNSTNSADTLSASKLYPIEEMSLHLSSTTSNGLEASNGNSLPTDLLQSLNEFKDICNTLDPEPEPTTTNCDQDIVGASS